MRTDIVIIGGGIVGCSAAYFLAKAGHKVTILEKNAGVGNEASGRSGCGVRQQGRKAALPLAMVSIQIWAALDAELNGAMEYKRTGNLRVRFDKTELEELETELLWEREQGLAGGRMLNPAECRELVRGISEKVVGGKFCPTDGIANPLLATPAIARLAQQLGVEIRTQTKVSGLLTHGSTVCGVKTDKGEVESRLVINAAGPWAQKFNESVGCHTPIQPCMSQLIITERLPRMITPFTGFTSGYVLQPKSGNVVIGISGKPEDTFRKGVDFPDITKKTAEMIERLPWLGRVKFIRSLSGITERTPDGEPYIGAAPGISGYLMACGFHGQGFCVGPGAGRVIAELVERKEPCVSLASFEPGRFTHS
jgi:sarcosine oxidase subunit beta